MKAYIRIALISIGIVAVIGLIASLIFRKEIRRVYFALSLFSGKEQTKSFRAIDEIFPIRVVSKSGNPRSLEYGETIALPSTYEHEGSDKNLAQFLEETDTTGLLIIKDSSVVFEEYYLGNTQNSRTIGWSVTKSLVSALVGIALSEGYINSIDDPITNYIPELKDSAYNEVSIKNILQMSSGARWNEDYSDFNSDINRFARIFALGRPLNKFVLTLDLELEPGTFNRYNSIDTQVLGILISRTTGQTLSQYLEEKIWQPLGMESDGYWILDGTAVEFAAGGLSATLRDYARFGQLYLNRGTWDGQQIIPERWVQDSVTPDAPHLQPGDTPQSDWVLGYGYQWWLMDGTEGEFSAIGIYNQFVYVNPAKSLVIVKASANRNYGIINDEASYRELETIEVFREIGRSL